MVDKLLKFFLRQLIPCLFNAKDTKSSKIIFIRAWFFQLGSRPDFTMKRSFNKIFTQLCVLCALCG